MKKSYHRWFSILCITIGCLCLLYYLYLSIVYGLNRIVFSWLFLCTGFLLVVFSALALFKQKHILSYLPNILQRIFLVLITCGILVFSILSSCIIYQGAHRSEQTGEAALILGAQLNGSSISRLLRYRLESGLQYAKDHPHAYIIVSGGQGELEACSEAKAMKDYLVQHGVSASRILVEDASMNTQQNLAYSKKLMKQYQIANVSIITNDFHMFRAGIIARQQAIPYYAYPARSDLDLAPNFILRECFGAIKDITIHLLP